MLDPRTFAKLAGGPFVHSRPWNRISSFEKRFLFWSFFESPEGEDARAWYSGERVRGLLERRQHSVEHVVPRAVLLRYMPDAPTRVRNGACANPLNFAAEAPRLNQARGELAFDLDDDPVARRVAVVRDDHVGIDRDGQWVPPRRSRGDIARTVLYMMFVYRLRFTPDRRWLAWAEADPPSQTERAFSRWTRRRWGIGNPLVERPGLLHELSDALPWR